MNARIDISPEGCAARKARIEAGVVAELVRKQKLSDARALTRSAQIHTDYELLAAMQNLHACVKTHTTLTNEYAEKLLELCVDLDNELREPEPELSSTRFSEPGEFDGATVGVRGRA